MPRWLTYAPPQPVTQQVPHHIALLVPPDPPLQYRFMSYLLLPSRLPPARRCPSAPELRRLKWASGLGTGLTEADLLSDRWQSYTLASQSVVAFGTYLRIT